MKRLLPALVVLASLLTGSQVTAAADPPRAITVGTSIEAGVGNGPGESWPQRLALRAPGYAFTDMSLGGGAYTADNSAGDNIRKHVDAAIAQHPDVIILGGPVNDLVSLYDVSPLRWAVFNAASAVQNAGIRVVVMAIPSFNDGGAFTAGWWPTLEQRRQDYNTWCASMYAAQCVDVSWAVRETTTQRGDRRWFRDGLHPNRVGAALLAEAFPIDRLA